MVKFLPFPLGISSPYDSPPPTSRPVSSYNLTSLIDNNKRHQTTPKTLVFIRTHPYPNLSDSGVVPCLRPHSLYTCSNRLLWKLLSIFISPFYIFCFSFDLCFYSHIHMFLNHLPFLTLPPSSSKVV